MHSHLGGIGTTSFNMTWTILQILLFVSIVGSVAQQQPSLLRKISPEENAQIQRFCRNPEFGDGPEQGVRTRGLILGGDPVLPGTFPWVAALFISTPSGFDQAVCGGTIISQRHILTARHCIEGIKENQRKNPGTKWWIEVGGVCSRVDENNGCPQQDMVDVPYSRAIYAFQASEAEMAKRKAEGGQKVEVIAHSVTDFAIVELADDLALPPFTPGSRQVQIACLPSWEWVSPRLYVYGWGNTLRDMKKAMSTDPMVANKAESLPSAHLMEIELYTLGRDALMADEQRRQECVSDRLVCAQSPEAVRTKDAARGDSGTGIVGQKLDNGLIYVEAITIAGIEEQMINIGLLTHSIGREICVHTGICLKQSWAQSGGDLRVLESDGGPMIVVDQMYPN